MGRHQPMHAALLVALRVDLMEQPSPALLLPASQALQLLQYLQVPAVETAAQSGQ